MTDPTIIAAAIVTVVAAIAAATVTVVSALAAAKERVIAASERLALKAAADLAAKKVDEVANKAVAIAVRAGQSDAKLDAIQAQNQEVAKNVDGNLTAVREELARASAANAALHHTVTSLQETVTALTDILVQTQKRTARVSDAASPASPALPASTVATTVNVDADTVNVKKKP